MKAIHRHLPNAALGLPANVNVWRDCPHAFGTFERADAERIAHGIVASELRAMVARHGTIGGNR